jgi:hypothetical protein
MLGTTLFLGSLTLRWAREDTKTSSAGIEDAFPTWVAIRVFRAKAVAGCLATKASAVCILVAHTVRIAVATKEVPVRPALPSAVAISPLQRDATGVGTCATFPAASSTAKSLCMFGHHEHKSSAQSSSTNHLECSPPGEGAIV